LCTCSCTRSRPLHGRVRIAGPSSCICSPTLHAGALVGVLYSEAVQVQALARKHDFRLLRGLRGYGTQVSRIWHTGQQDEARRSAERSTWRVHTWQSVVCSVRSDQQISRSADCSVVIAHAEGQPQTYCSGHHLQCSHAMFCTHAEGQPQARCKVRPVVAAG